MPKEPIGVAVISAGMAGRAHAAGYRAAGSVFDASAPYVRPWRSPISTTSSPRTQPAPLRTDQQWLQIRCDRRRATTAHLAANAPDSGRDGQALLRQPHSAALSAARAVS